MQTYIKHTYMVSTTIIATAVLIPLWRSVAIIIMFWTVIGFSALVGISLAKASLYHLVNPYKTLYKTQHHKGPTPRLGFRIVVMQVGILKSVWWSGTWTPGASTQKVGLTSPKPFQCMDFGTKSYYLNGYLDLQKKPHQWTYDDPYQTS